MAQDQSHHSTAAAGVDLGRRMILAYVDGGVDELLLAVNGAASELELGFAATYLISCLASLAEIAAGSRHAGLELLRNSADGCREDAVLTELRVLLDGGEA